MIIGRIFHFDSAHYLPDYNGNCEKLHGHTYKLEIVLNDEVQTDGMVLDFGILKKIVKENVLDKIDHISMNELIDNPTAENIVEWIWDELKDKLPLHYVELWEGDGKWVRKQSAY